jgi:hypothetical protein
MGHPGQQLPPQLFREVRELIERPVTKLLEHW